MSRARSQSFSFDAIQVSQHDFVFYLAVLPAIDVLPLCSALRATDSRLQPIDPRELEQNDGSKFVQAIEISDFARSEFAKEVEDIQESEYKKDEPFQRILEEVRVRQIISYYLEENSLMPNAVILAVRDNAVVEINGQGPLFKITLEWDEDRPTNIIDGQHRLEALRMLVDGGHADFRDFDVPFSLLIDFPFYMQAEMFAVINGRQKPVNRSRIYDLLGYMPLKDKHIRELAYRGEMAVYRFCHHAIKVLNTSARSPWHNLIKMRGTGQGVVTQAALVDHLARLVVPRKDTPRLQTLPILYPYFRHSDLVGLSKVCVLYFLGIKAAWPEQWQNETALKRSLFGKTNGIAVMFMILHDLAILLGGPENITAEAIMKFWGKAPRARIEEPPVGGGRGYQNEWYEAIMERIVGEDFRAKVRRKAEPARAELLDIGGLF